jgi:uncharacterized protein (DUF983 family)
LKGTKIYSILNQKCPKCHEGELFDDRKPYHLKKIFDMPERCEKCNQLYQLEPSFFYGAMYVNYGFTVAIAVAVFVAMAVLGSNWELHHYLIGIIIAIFLLAPLTFRLGRTVWINMFIKYNPNALDEEEKAQALKRGQ